MTPGRRFSAPAVALLASLALAACSTQATPTVAPSPTVAATASVPSPAPTVDVVARDAYNAAICPIFLALLELDPRLASMRSAGAEGGDMSFHAEEIGALSDELGALLNDLEEVPEWAEGANLRIHLIGAYHGIRARLLHVAGDPAGSSAAEDLAALPFVSSDAMDIAMQRAVGAGLTCEVAS